MNKLKVLAAFAAMSSIVCADTVQELEKAFDKAVSSGRPLSAERAFEQLIEKGAKLSPNRYRQAAEVARQLGKIDQRNARIAHFLKIEKNQDADALRLAYVLAFEANNAEAIALLAPKNADSRIFFNKSMTVLRKYVTEKRVAEFKIVANALLPAFKDGASRDAIYGCLHDILMSGTPGISFKEAREMIEKYPADEATQISRIMYGKPGEFPPLWRLKYMVGNPSSVLQPYAFDRIFDLVHAKDKQKEKEEAYGYVQKLKQKFLCKKYLQQAAICIKFIADLRSIAEAKSNKKQVSSEIRSYIESIIAVKDGITRDYMRDILYHVLSRGALDKADVVFFRDKYPEYASANLDILLLTEEFNKTKSIAPIASFIAKIPNDEIRLKDDLFYNALGKYGAVKDLASVKKIIEERLARSCYYRVNTSCWDALCILDEFKLPDAEITKFLKHLHSTYGSQQENHNFWREFKGWQQARWRKLNMFDGKELLAFQKELKLQTPPSDKMLAIANKMRGLRWDANYNAPNEAHKLFAEACQIYKGKYNSKTTPEQMAFSCVMNMYFDLCRYGLKSMPILLEAICSKLDKDDPKVWVEFFGHGRYHHVYNYCREKPDVMRNACIACANATKDLSYARDVTYPAKTDKLDFSVEMRRASPKAEASLLTRNWHGWSNNDRFFTPRLAADMARSVLTNMKAAAPDPSEKEWFGHTVFPVIASIIAVAPNEFKDFNLDPAASVILTGKPEDDYWAKLFLYHLCGALNVSDKYLKVFAKAIEGRKDFEKANLMSWACAQVAPVVKGSYDTGLGWAFKNCLIPALKSVPTEKAPLVALHSNNDAYIRFTQFMEGSSKPDWTLLKEYSSECVRLLSNGAKGFNDSEGSAGACVFRDVYNAALAKSNAVEIARIARETGSRLWYRTWGVDLDVISKIADETARQKHWEALYLLTSTLPLVDKSVQVLVANHRAEASKHLPGIYPVSERDPLYPLYVAADEFGKNNTERATELLMKNLSVFEKDAFVLPPDFVAWAVDQMRLARGKNGALLVRARTLASRLLEDESKLSSELAAALLLVRAECNRDQQNFEVAKLEYQSIRNNPVYSKTKYGRKAMYRDIDLMIEMGNASATESTLEYWLSQPDVEIQAQAHYFLARIAFERKDYEECRKQLKEVFSIDFTHTEGRFLEGRWKLATGNEVDDTEIMIGNLTDRTMVRPGQQLAISVQDRNLSLAGGGASIPVIIQTTPGGDRERILLYPTPRDPTLFRGVIDVKLGKSVVSNLTLEVSGKDITSYNIDTEFLKARGLPIPPPKSMKVVDDARLIIGTGAPRTEESEEEDGKKKIEDIINSSDLASYRPPSLRPGNPLHVAVMDKDMSSGDDSSIVVKVSTSSGDVLENLVLKEVRPYSGIFLGEIPTSLPPPRAYASDTAIGYNPGDVISTKRNGGWKSLSDSKKGKSFSVDTMGSHVFSNIVVKMSSAEELRRLRIVGKIGNDDVELAHFPAAPSTGRTGLRRWVGNARSLRGDKAVKTFFDSNLNIKPQIVTNITCVGKKDRNGNACVSYFKGAFFVDSSNEAFRLLIAPVKNGSSFRNLVLSINIDGKNVLSGFGPSLTNQIFSRRLTRGCHTLEVVSIQNYEEDAWELCWNPVGEEAKHIPASWFDEKLHPELNEYLADKAQIVRDAEGFNVTFRAPTRLRSFTLEFIEHNSSAVSLSKIYATDWSGKGILPVETDFSEAQKNGMLEVAPGDSISVRYEDKSTSSGRPRVVNKSINSSFNDADIGFYYEQIVVENDNQVMKHCYSAYRFIPGDKLLVGLRDQDLDVSDEADTAEVVITMPNGEKQKLLLVEQQDMFACNGTTINSSQDIVGVHSAFFLGLVTTHQKGVTNGVKKSSIECTDESELIVSYVDRENTSPGVPFVRTARVPATSKSNARLTVFNSRTSRVIDKSPAAQARISALRRRAGNEKVDRLYTTQVTASLADRATLNSTNDIPANISAPLFLRVNDPSLARHSSSYVTLEVVTESERARAELDGDEPDVKSTKVRLAAPFEGGNLSNGRESLEEALANGSFNCTIKLLMGEITPELLAPAHNSLNAGYEPIALPVTGHDRIHVTVKDSEGNELIKRTFCLISNAEMELVDSSLIAERTSVHVGERLYVKVSDADRDLTEDPDNVEVQVETTGGTRRKVILTESLPHSGIFSGSVRPIIIPPSEKIPSVITGATASVEELIADDRIPVKFGEKLIITYTDSKVLPGYDAYTLSVTGTVYKGADGSVRLFSKRFRDVDAAVLVQFRLAECLFEQAKDFRKLKQVDKSSEAIAKGRGILEEALKNNPESAHVAQGEFLLANLYQELAAEEDVLAKQLRSDGDEEASAEATKKSRQLYAEALARFSSILAVWPEGEYAPRAQYHKAYCLEMLKDYKLAGEEYVKMTYMYPESDLVGDATIRLATYYFREEKKYQTAARIYESFARRFPNHDKAARALFMSGSCYIKEGETIHKKAVEAARLAAEKTKREFSPNQVYMPVATVENYTRAVNAFVDMAEKYQAVTTPELRAQGLYWAGDASLRKDDVKAAYIFLKRAVLEYPETEWARRARGLLLQNGKRFRDID